MMNPKTIPKTYLIQNVNPEDYSFRLVHQKNYITYDVSFLIYLDKDKFREANSIFKKLGLVPPELTLGTNKYYDPRGIFPRDKKGYGVIVYKKEKNLRQYLKELEQFSISNKKNKKDYDERITETREKIVKFFQDMAMKTGMVAKSPLSKYIYGDFEFNSIYYYNTERLTPYSDENIEDIVNKLFL